MTPTQASLESSRLEQNFRTSEATYQGQKGDAKPPASPCDPTTNKPEGHLTGQNNIFISKYLKKLNQHRLWGRPYIKAYLFDLNRRGCRPNTIRASFGAIFLFMSYLKSLGRTYLESVIRQDLAGFIEHEQDRGMKPNTVCSRLRVLYAFFKFLVDRNVVHQDILKNKFRIKVPDTLPRAIDPEDVRELLAVIKKPRDWAMVLILLRTGMRIGELLNLTADEVNMRENRIDIFEAEKTRVGRVVYFSDDARLALKVWLKRRDMQKTHIFYSQRRNSMSYETARRMFCKYLHKAGLSNRRYTLHCLRHTFASELLNAGMRLECVQQLLGHSSIEITRRYARLTDNTRRQEYFRAMAVIEKGEINGHYRIDTEL
jgi:integrase/recombinase XerD